MTFSRLTVDSSQDELLTYAECARICGWKTVQPIRRAVKLKKLRMIQLSHKSRRIRRGDLELYIRLRTKHILVVPAKS